MLFRGGLNAVTLQIQLYTLILGGLVALSRHNLVWIVCGITSLDYILSRHRATLTFTLQRCHRSASEVAFLHLCHMNN